MLESWLYCSIQFWRQWLREGWKILLRKVMEPATSRGVRNHYEKLCQVVIVKNATNVSKLWKEYREIQKTTQEWTLAQIRSSLANSAEIAIARHTPHSDRKLRNLRLVKRPLYHFFRKSPNGLNTLTKERSSKDYRWHMFEQIKPYGAVCESCQHIPLNYSSIRDTSRTLYDRNTTELFISN